MPIPHYVLALRKKIGNDLMLLPGVTAVVFNERGELLLQRRSDNGRWGILGGVMEPGDSPDGAILREIEEETGLRVTIDRLSGVYAEPSVTYSNGDQAQYVTICFRCLAAAGQTPRITDDESLELTWFAADQLPADLIAKYRRNIADALEPGAHVPARFG